MRPYFNSTIADLERLFAQSSSDRQRLQVLADELGHRSTDRAGALAAKVRAVLESVPTREKAPQPASEPLQSPPPPEKAAASRPPVEQEPKPAKPIANDAADIIQAWTALEVLSPPTFVRPEALAGGDRRNIAQFDRGLPWERGDKAKPGTRVYYQIVLGTIDLPKAVERLTRVFSDSRAERPRREARRPWPS